MHVIRLRRPWEKMFNGGADSIRIDVPEPVDGSADDANAVLTSTYSRHFNLPSGLNDSTRVVLQIESWQGKIVSLFVNDHVYPIPLTGDTSVECDITDVLQASNKINVQLDAMNDRSPRLSGAVNLLISEHETD